MKPIILVGCGHLGQAMLRRWLDHNEDYHFTVVKPSPLPDDLASHARVTWVAEPPNAAEAAAIIYAVRPQQLAAILPAYRDLARTCPNISVAAGWTLKKLAQYLGDAAIIRTMPNLPAQIGLGVTAAVANDRCDQATKDLAENLLHATGEVAWLDDERQMDAVTALSGSGPAYAFLLAAAMEEAGIKLGLPQPVAGRLARQTVYGAAAYMVQGDQAADELWRAMQLPGGTTEAAFTRLLAADGMTPMILEAMQRAAACAAEIGQSS
ncbi:MAG: pyrroline-5-carboxylate reductase [Alphaproteobacteria bacterium]